MRSGSPCCGRSDLPAELRHRLVWTVAAALRRYAIERHALDPAAADNALAAAAAASFPAMTRPTASRRGRCGSPARSRARPPRRRGLRRGGRAGQFAAAACEPGGADRLGFEAGWGLLADPAGAGAALLLRAAGLDRAAAGSSCSACRRRCRRRGPPRPVRHALRRRVARLLAPWRADPAYRAAIAELAA